MHSSVQFALLLCLALLKAVVFSLSAEIVSCSGWKLNHLPEVKRFLKEQGHADAYNELKVSFVSGRTPELFIKDDSGSLLETINLSKYSTDELHELMIKKGLTRKIVGASSGPNGELRKLRKSN